MKKLRIAQVSTIWERTPPKLYGGTERVVSDLTEELVRMGHDVTLFATGDSKTAGSLRSIYPRAAYRDGVPWNNLFYPVDHVSTAFLNASDFDVIHMHLNKSQDYIALVLAGLVKTPTIFTIHFPLPLTSEKEKRGHIYFLKKYGNRNYISISNAQRTLSGLNYVGTVHNGLDFSHYPAVDSPVSDAKDLVWIGRFCDEKGPKEAIEVAKRSGYKLIMAGKIDRLSEKAFSYYQKEIEHKIDGKHIEYIGEVNDKQKIALLKKAKALLVPINWNEPFGLTTIEAMAMGVPVIAFDMGPVHEIIEDGKTGFIVKNIAEMVRAVKKTDGLNRQYISQYARNWFGSGIMANNYIKLYNDILSKKK